MPSSRPEGEFKKIVQGDWPEPRLKRCSHSRTFPVDTGRDDQCNNVSEFLVCTSRNPEGAAICGQCLPVVIKMLFRRFPEVHVRNVLA